MKSIFDNEAHIELKQRVEKVDVKNPPIWGKMNAGQMMHHCQKAFELPLGKSTVKKSNFLIRQLFKLFKSTMYNDKLWKKSLPTVKEFVVKDTKDFAVEKQKLMMLMDEFVKTGKEKTFDPHPSFGHFTQEQWGKMQYKHLDHHLRQFGV